MHTHKKGHPWLAALMDLAMKPVYHLRKDVVAEAQGHVLEIGVGTGLNFSLYPEDVESLTGVDPDPYMLKRAQRRSEGLPFPIELQEVGAEALPYPDASFDTVVVTWTFCTIPQPKQAAQEIHRVLKPGGRLIWIEHTRSRFPVASRLQRWITPIWKRFAGGCHLNREPVTLLKESGFNIEEVGPRGSEGWTLFPIYRGIARKPG